MKDETKALAKRICELVADKNAEKVVLMDVAGLCSYADALVICHGRSSRQTQAISNHVVASLKKEGSSKLGVEGDAQGHWILVDFADVVLHIFYEPVRKFYNIEGIWPEVESQIVSP